MPNPRHLNTRRRVVVSVSVGLVVGLVAGLGGGVVGSSGVVGGLLIGVGVGGGVVGVGADLGGAVVRLVVGNGRSGGLAVQGAGRLLPATVRETYVEEWRGWLHDLRVDGAPWHRRLAELLSIVLAAPRLAVTLWLTRQRAVD